MVRRKILGWDEDCAQNISSLESRLDFHSGPPLGEGPWKSRHIDFIDLDDCVMLGVSTLGATCRSGGHPPPAGEWNTERLV